MLKMERTIATVKNLDNILAEREVGCGIEIEK
jgi:hypothetical protein